MWEEYLQFLEQCKTKIDDIELVIFLNFLFIYDLFFFDIKKKKIKNNFSPNSSIPNFLEHIKKLQKMDYFQSKC